MKHQRLLVLAVLAAFSLAAAGCSVGPVAIGLPVSGSSSTRLSPSVSFQAVCLPSGGHLKIEFDSTAGSNPERVTYYLAIDLSPNPVALNGPVGSHFERTDGYPFKPGECAEMLSLVPECQTPCPAWAASSQTFNYRVSIVP